MKRWVPRRRVVTVVSFVVGLTAMVIGGGKWWTVRSATLTRNECVARVEVAGGLVTFHHQYGANRWVYSSTREPPPDPLWRRLPFGQGSRLRIHAIRFLNGETPDSSVLKALQKLHEVRALFLQGTLADDETMAIISNWRTLETLVLDGTRVTERELARITSLKALEVLRIDGIAASDESLAAISACKGLRQLSCVDTPITAGGIARLQKTRPQLVIEWGGTSSKEVREAANRLERLGFYVDRRYDTKTKRVWYAVASPNVLLAQVVSMARWRGSKKDRELLRTVRGLPRLNLESSLDRSDLFDDDVMEIVSQLLSLRELSIRDCLVTDIGLASLRRLRHLQRLDASGTKITNRGLTYVAAMPTLECLRIARTSIGDDGLAYLKVLISLKSLDLSHTRVTDEGMQRLATLTSLRELVLAGTAVGDSGIRNLQALGSLVKLDLRHTRVTDESVDTLGELRNLRELWLTHTQLSVEAKAKLRSSLPDCLIRQPLLEATQS